MHMSYMKLLSVIKIKWFLFPSFLLLLLIMSVNCASATIDLTDVQQLVVLTDETISLQDLYDYIKSVKGESITEELYIEPNNSTVGAWMVKGRIESAGNAFLTLNASDDTVYFSYLKSGGTFLCGAVWEDVTIRSWSISANDTGPWDTRLHRYSSDSYFKNVTWDEAGTTRFGDSTHYRNNITILDCTITGWYTHTQMYGYYFTVDGFDMIDSYSIWDSERAGIRSAILYNSTLKNVYINPFKTFERPVRDSTGSYGVQISGSNNTLENVHVENTSYSGYNINSHYSNYTNVSVHNADHNQFEANGWISVYNDISITGGNATYTDHGWFTSTPNVAAANVTVDGLYIDTTGNGEGIRLLGEVDALDDYHFKNVTLINDGINSGNTKDLILENVTLHRTGNFYFWQFADMLNTTILNSNFTSDSGGYYTLVNSNLSLINTNFVDTQSGSTAPWSTSVYYPLNAIVLDNAGDPVENATITVDSTMLSLDGYGTEQSVFTTGADGKPTETINLANGTQVSGIGYTYFVSNVTASKDSESVSILNINPDASYYSSVLDDFQGPLQTFNLNIEGAETSPDANNVSTSSSSTRGTVFSTTTVNIPYTPVPTTISSYQMWAAAFIIGLVIFISGLTDTNPKIKQGPALLLGSVICMVAGSYIGLLPLDINEAINIIAGNISKYAA